MILNFFWLTISSGIAFISTLYLSSVLNISDFGIASSLFSACGFLIVLCTRGQNGLLLSKSYPLESNPISIALVRIGPIYFLILAASFVFYIQYHTPTTEGLLVLQPYILLGVISQLLVGHAQASLKIAQIGFFQAAPSIGRSLPAVAWAAFSHIFGFSLSLEEYLLVTSVFCVLLLLVLGLFNPVLHKFSRLNLSFSAHAAERGFWFSSILSTAYVGLLSPLVLFLWGRETAGALGIYVLLWGVANIVITAVFNNYLLPHYGNLRSNTQRADVFLARQFLYAIATSIAVGTLCMVCIYFGMQKVWTSDYKQYEASLYLCTVALMVRPVTAWIGLPLNFPETVSRKNTVQLSSLVVLLCGASALSPLGDFLFLAALIVFTELYVLACYLRLRARK